MDAIRWSFELLKILVDRRNDYDIAHFHSLGWGALLSPLVLNPLGKKLVFTMSLYGNDNPSYIRQQPRGRLQIALMRRFNGAIGLSPALVKDAIKNGIRNVICLPNFLAIPVLEEEPIPGARLAARERLGIPQHAHLLLFIGSIIHRKGVDVLVDAFEKIAKKYPDLWLALVGPQSRAESPKIDEVYVTQQKEKIRKAKIGERVLWIGLVKEQSQLTHYYWAADIFILPTRNEGSPNVLAEAMTAGLPIVATHLTGITDQLVLDGENGYLVGPDHPDQLVDALEKMLVDESKRIAMGAAGRKMALDKFGFIPYCQQLKNFYLCLLEAKCGEA